MSQIDLQDQEDKPLDPALERVRRKMMILLFCSIGSIMFCLMLVLAAIVYKLMHAEPKKVEPTAISAAGVPSEQPLNVTARLPEGFNVTSTALSGSQVLFFGQMPNGRSRGFIFDATTGRILSDITVETGR